MKEVLLSAVFATTFATAIALQAGTAYASDANAEVALCTSALAEQGLVNADEYRSKFTSRSGGRLTTITFRLIPKNGGETLVGECAIRRGEVESATIKA